MDILTAIKERRSIRKFKDKDIPGEVVDRLVDSLIWAPSAGNLQSRHFFFIRDRDKKEELVGAALGQAFIAGAPLVIVGCSDSRISARYGDRGVFLYSIQDVAASIQNLMLAAHEEGLGSVWVGAFNEGDVHDILDLPNYLRAVAIVPIGYPARVPSPSPRVGRDEAVTFV